jgi:CheY-like chemotaxis protein
MTATPPKESGPVILVVEDEQPLLEAIRTKLEQEGFSVLTARSVAQATEYLGSVPKISFVWLDHYLLGKETGLDFVGRLKENPQWKTIPIFVVSNTATPDKIQSYLHLGAEKYYAKVSNRLDGIVEDMKRFLDGEKS